MSSGARGQRQVFRPVVWPPPWNQKPSKSLPSHATRDPLIWSQGAAPTPIPLQPHSYYGIDTRTLVPRDQCSDVFGSNRTDATCAPSSTLCCVIFGEMYPSCHQYLGKGWCCVGSNPNDKCFWDQPAAGSCDEPDAVRCTNVESASTEACCPPPTVCDPDHTVQNWSRCKMSHRELKAVASSLQASPSASSTMLNSSSALSSISATTSASVTTTSAMHDAATSEGPSPAPTATTPARASSMTVSTTTLIGAVIGAVAAVCLLAVVGWILVRRRRKQHAHGARLIDPRLYVRHSQVKAGGWANQIPWELDANHRDFVYELDGTSIRYK